MPLNTASKFPEILVHWEKGWIRVWLTSVTETKSPVKGILKFCGRLFFAVAEDKADCGVCSDTLRDIFDR